MKNTLICTAICILLAFNHVFSQSHLSGPQVNLETLVPQPAVPEAGIKAALKDLSFQLLDLELGTARLERRYQAKTPFFEVVDLDLLKGMSLQEFSTTCEYQPRIDLLGELETMHLSMIDLEVELGELDKALDGLSPYDTHSPMCNVELTPDALAMEVDHGLVARYQSLAQSAKDLFTVSVVEELEALARHMVVLEAKAIVLKAALGNRKEIGGLAAMESE